MVNTAFACQFTWGVNLKANAVFTIFALYLTLVCTFCTKFARSKFGVNPIFRAVPLQLKPRIFEEKLAQVKRSTTYLSGPWASQRLLCFHTKLGEPFT